MNLNELQSVQSKERQTDSLQQLRDSFYQEVGRFVAQLKSERQEAAAAAEDPFDSEEVQRLTDEIKTAEETVEAIYERRIGKLVKQASLEAAGMAADADGMTTEEREAFEALVATIEENRAHVLGTVVGEDGDGPGDPATAPDADTTDADAEADDGAGAGADPATDPDDLPDDVPPDVPPGVPPDLHEDPDAAESGTGVDAADAMGGESSPDGGDSANAGGSAGRDSEAGDPATGNDATGDRSTAGGGGGTDRREPSSAAASTPGAAVQVTADEPGEDEPAAETATTETATTENATVERATVRITADVGEILGVDERSYDLACEDVVTLPEANAGPLVEKGAAERLD